MLYPKPYCIIDRDGNYAMYVQGFMANEISQSIFVSDIKVNILDYKCAENLFAFTHSILCGGRVRRKRSRLSLCAWFR